MTPGVSLAACFRDPAVAGELADYLGSRPALGGYVTLSTTSTVELVRNLPAVRPRAVLLDLDLGAAALSLASELHAAGWPVLALCRTAPDPMVTAALATELPLLSRWQAAQIMPAVHALLAGEPSPAGACGCRTVAFYSPRGGAGTSTVALSAAYLLARRGARVALVELAAFGAAVGMLKLPEVAGWAPLLSAVAEDPAGLKGPGAPRALAAALDHVADASGSSIALLASAGPTGMDRIGEEEVRDLLSLLPAAGFDFLILDLPQELSERSVAALVHAEHLAVVATADAVAAYRLVQLCPVLEALRIDRDRGCLIANRVRPDGLLTADDLARLLPFPLSAALPEDPRAVHPAFNREPFTGFRTGSAAESALTRWLGQLLAPESGRPDGHRPAAGPPAGRRSCAKAPSRN